MIFKIDAFISLGFCEMCRAQEVDDRLRTQRSEVMATAVDSSQEGFSKDCGVCYNGNEAID